MLTSAFQTRQTIEEWANKLVGIADQAYAIRQFDAVAFVGQVLLNLSPNHESIGHYYQAINLNNRSSEDVASARSLFEKVADDAHSQYRHRAVLALGGNFLRNYDSRTAMSLYHEVFRIMTLDRIFDPVTVYGVSRMSAVIRAFEGDHNSAVADLERLFPLARMAGSLQSYAYYDYLNALAVELGEVGRVNEAHRASEIAISSPYAAAYPEWRETFDDIEYRRRRASGSAVAVPKQIERAADGNPQKTPSLSSGRTATNTRQTPRPKPNQSGNLVLLPARKCRVQETIEKSNGRVLSFQKWKMASQKPSHLQPEKLTPEQRELLTTPQKLVRIIDLISRDETDDEAIDRILDAVEEIALGRSEDKIS